VAHLLGVEGVGVDFPTKTVFESVTLGIDEGDRIGIVGRNGDGKSTLLSILSGRLEPHSGRVTTRGGVHIGMLDQTDTLDQTQTVGHAIVGDMPDYEWAGDAKIRDVIAGLVSDIPWDSTVGTLSGGQRRRVALAALLIGDDDVLFLDEPTNHLDVEGITWLAGHLKNRWSPNAGGLLVVTHDRWFLDEVCNATWEVHDGIVEPFEGGYAAYILQRVERDRHASATESKRQNLMRKELAWLRRGAPARTAKPKFRIDAANALIENEPPPRNPIELKQMATARLGKDVVDILDVSVSYGDLEVLKHVEWRIGPGERTGILGANGVGKSTLLGLVTGTVQPTSGRVKRGKTVKVVSLTQELNELKEVGNDRVSDVVGRQRTAYVSGGKEMTPSQLLERLGFSNAQMATPVRDLSGGQKRRLQLLLILLDEPNVLVLDEPTNDLDTDMLAAMEDLLDSWPGTLLVVSHDRYLLERITDQQYAILDGHFRHLPGGVDQYLRLRKEQDSPAASNPSTAGHEAAVPRLSSAELRNTRKEIASIDRKMEKLSARIDAIHTEMAQHDPTDGAGLSALSTEVSRLEAQVAEHETRWIELSELVDA
jgi:ATPase subunit of ABC transporter with duplicated ATPase domains